MSLDFSMSHVFLAIRMGSSPITFSCGLKGVAGFEQQSWRWGWSSAAWARMVPGQQFKQRYH
eukprot:761508-Hanusia_phi.AAC.7